MVEPRMIMQHQILHEAAKILEEQGELLQDAKIEIREGNKILLGLDAAITRATERLYADKRYRRLAWNVLAARLHKPSILSSAENNRKRVENFVNAKGQVLANVLALLRNEPCEVKTAA